MCSVIKSTSSQHSTLYLLQFSYAGQWIYLHINSTVPTQVGGKLKEKIKLNIHPLNLYGHKAHKAQPAPHHHLLSDYMYDTYVSSTYTRLYRTHAYRHEQLSPTHSPTPECRQRNSTNMQILLSLRCHSIAHSIPFPNFIYIKYFLQFFSRVI